MVRATLAVAAVIVSTGLNACGGRGASGPPSSGADTTKIPISDMTRANARYLGFAGGLYPGGNAIPAAHLTAGMTHAKAIQPLDVNGNPSASGRYVLISIGMSNTTQEFCSASSNPPCSSWSFAGQASADPAVNNTTLAIVNGARGGQAASSWTSPTSPEYDRIRDSWLTPSGLSERQVQVAWVKVPNAQPTLSLPADAAEAYLLFSLICTIA